MTRRAKAIADMSDDALCKALTRANQELLDLTIEAERRAGIAEDRAAMFRSLLGGDNLPSWSGNPEITVRPDAQDSNAEPLSSLSVGVVASAARLESCGGEPEIDPLEVPPALRRV